jgi:hypothetical protein
MFKLQKSRQLTVVLGGGGPYTLIVHCWEVGGNKLLRYKQTPKKTTLLVVSILFLELKFW